MAFTNILGIIIFTVLVGIYYIWTDYNKIFGWIGYYISGFCVCYNLIPYMEKTFTNMSIRLIVLFFVLLGIHLFSIFISRYIYKHFIEKRL